jgi:hypothetical protein
MPIRSETSSREEALKLRDDLVDLPNESWNALGDVPYIAPDPAEWGLAPNGLEMSRPASHGKYRMKWLTWPGRVGSIELLGIGLSFPNCLREA